MADTVVKQMEVFETTEYDKFTLIKGNRKTDPGHIRGLQKSILDHGNLTIDHPIEVDKDFQIYDGQHRLAALKNLGLPVYYVFKKESTVKDIRISNSNRKNWNWHDYASSYRDELNNNHYRQFLELYDAFHYPFRVLMAYSGVGAVRSGKNLQNFLEGNFTMKDFKKTRESLEIYQELSDVAKIHNREFALAAYRFMNSSTYNHAHMLEKLRAHRKALNNCYFEQDYLYTMQDIWRA